MLRNKPAGDCLVDLRTIEVLASACVCPQTLKVLLSDVHTINKLAQSDHHDDDPNWVEVICFAEGVRSKIVDRIEREQAPPPLVPPLVDPLADLHPVIAQAFKPFVQPLPPLPHAA